MTFKIIGKVHDMTNCTVFSNVKGSYPPSEDITINFEHNGEVSTTSRDWVGLFRCGWTSIREHDTFEWVPRPIDEYNVSDCKVVFSGRLLPRADDGQRYEFCYIDRYGVSRGSSRPFVITKTTRIETVAVEPKGKRESCMLGKPHAVYYFIHPTEGKAGSAPTSRQSNGMKLDVESHGDVEGDGFSGRTMDTESGHVHADSDDERLISMEVHAATFNDKIHQLEMSMQLLSDDNILLRERVRSNDCDMSALMKTQDDEKALRLITEQQLLATQQELSSVRLSQTSPSLKRSFGRPAVFDKNSVYLPMQITSSIRSSPLLRQCPYCNVNFPANMLKTDVEGHVLTHLL